MYTRQKLVDLSDFSIKQINDNFSAIFLKLSGNIDTIDLKDNSITTPKIVDGAVTADKIATGSISVGHLDSEFIENFPLLENPVFISYAEDLSIVDNHVKQHATLIQQNADTIALQATAIDGLGTDLSALIVRADEIASVVASDREFVDNEIIRIDDEFATVNTTIANQYSTLTQRADEIETNVGNLTTTVTTNYDNLTGEISSLSTIVTENHSSITQRADRIESNVSSISADVSSLDSRVSSHSSEISQLSNRISSKVSYTDYNGVEIASLINQDAYRITIDANAIDLTGITQIYDPYDSSNYARINGSTFELFRRGSVFFNISYGSWGTQLWSDNYNFDIYSGIDVRGESAFNSYVDFYNDVGFYGDVDFSRANVYGLDTDVDMRYIIECYYASNKCYIDLGSSHLIIRDDRGRVVGRITFD